MNDNQQSELYKKSQVIIFCSVVFFLGLLITIYIEYTKYFPVTDNAYISANLIKVQPKVSGNITKIYVNNNQFVKKGEKILKIDSTDYVLQLNKAKLDHLIAKNELLNSKKQVIQANADIEKARANYNLYEANKKRYDFLYKEHAASLQTYQEAFAKFIEAKEDLAQAQTAQEQAKVQFEASQEKVNLTLLQIENAQNQLGYTEILAPSDGYITDFNIHEGQLVGIGEILFGFVSSSVWWIDANYEETQIARIRPGQKVDVYLDMYSNKFTGVVQSLSYASGSTFSLLPPQNATGNWVKVTQRFPVRIIIKNDPRFPLRVGASTNVRVNTL